MKKAFWFAALPATFLTGFLVVLLLADEPAVTQSPVCQIAVGEPLQRAAGGAFGEGEWTVYSYDGTAKAPRVRVRELSAEELAAPTAAGGCELEVLAMPGPDSRGLDWRIGRVAADASPFRGRTVRARFLLRAAQQASFGSASVYLYDGATVAGVPVKTLGEAWTPFDVTHTVAEDAKAFELWFRLLLDRPEVSPARNRIELAVSLDEASEAEAAGAEAATLFSGPGYGEAACPLSRSARFREAAGEGGAPGHWVIYRHDGDQPAPAVEARFVAEERPAREGTDEPTEYCVLAVDGAPERPSAALDWRIGHAVAAAGLRGKTVRFAAKLRALAPTRFDSATLYLYDGKRVDGVPITSLDADWRELAVAQTVGEEATMLQAWLRLVYDRGTMVPGAAVIEFAPSLDVAE